MSSERKHGLSTEQFPVSAYAGSSKNLKDLKDLQLLELELLVVPREAPPLPPIAPRSPGAPRLLQRARDFLRGPTGSQLQLGRAESRGGA